MLGTPESFDGGQSHDRGAEPRFQSRNRLRQRCSVGALWSFGWETASSGRRPAGCGLETASFGRKPAGSRAETGSSAAELRGYVTDPESSASETESSACALAGALPEKQGWKPEAEDHPMKIKVTDQGLTIPEPAHSARISKSSEPCGPGALLHPLLGREGG